MLQRLFAIISGTIISLALFLLYYSKEYLQYVIGWLVILCFPFLIVLWLIFSIIYFIALYKNKYKLNFLSLSLILSPFITVILLYSFNHIPALKAYNCPANVNNQNSNMNDTVNFQKTRVHIKILKRNNNTGESFIIFFQEPIHCTGGDNYFLALYGSDGKIKDEVWVGYDMPINLSLNDSLKIDVIFKKDHNTVDIKKLNSKIGKYSIGYSVK
jgi:hypothetical protein